MGPQRISYRIAEAGLKAVTTTFVKKLIEALNELMLLRICRDSHKYPTCSP